MRTCEWCLAQAIFIFSSIIDASLPGDDCSTVDIMKLKKQKCYILQASQKLNCLLYHHLYIKYAARILFFINGFVIVTFQISKSKSTCISHLYLFTIQIINHHLPKQIFVVMDHSVQNCLYPFFRYSTLISHNV